MSKKIRILMVDDHPMILLGYELFLKSDNKLSDLNVNLKISKANNCDEALSFFRDSIVRFDIILLDIRLPGSNYYELMDGEDLGNFVVRRFPTVKIIVITSIMDNARILSIIKKLNPIGFLTKCDITPKLLTESIINALKYKKTFSPQVVKLLEPNIIEEEEVTYLDRKLLYYISIGERMKNLPNLLPMSMSSIERRKRYLLILFDIPSSSNRELIEEAKKRGYI